MPVGSILARFKEISLSTAEGKNYSVEVNPVVALAIRIFGVPHLWFRLRSRLLLRMFAGIDKSRSILNAGCGYGILDLTLVDRGYRITAVDLDQSRIEEIDKQKEQLGFAGANLATAVASVTELPYQDNYFDVVLSSEVVEHVDDDQQAVRELVRVTKPGGTLIVTTPSNSKSNATDYKQYDHTKPGYNKEDHEKLLVGLPAEIVDVHYFVYSTSKKMVNLLNRFSSKSLISLMFYPLYVICLLTDWLKIGEPNSIIVTIRKQNADTE